MADDGAVEESANPIWVLLGGGAGKTANLWILPPGGRSWRESLSTQAAHLADGEELIVSVPRPLALSALAVLARRRRTSSGGPSVEAVKGALAGHGLEVAASYGLWPSARSPRIAFPWPRFHMLHWLQRSGVLGGGGNRLWARILARSIFFTPLAAALAPGLAFVARRANDESST